MTTFLLRSRALFAMMVMAVACSHALRDQVGCFCFLGAETERKTDVVVFNGNNITALKQKMESKSSFKREIKAPEFDKYDSFTAPHEVRSISSFDYDHDGIADLCVVTQSSEHQQFQAHLYRDTQNEENKFELKSSIDLSDPTVLVIDINGDFTPDLFGQKTDESGNRVEGFFMQMQNDQFVALGADQGNIVMQSVSFIDLDQDCKADLVYITNDRKIKMIPNTDFSNPNNRNVYLLHELTPNDQSRLYFADVNKDGAMDIIVPSTTNKLRVFRQKNSKSYQDICSAETVAVEWDNYGTSIEIALGVENGYKLAPNLPLIVQDINMDKDVNLVAVVENNSQQQKVIAAQLSDLDASSASSLADISEMSSQIMEAVPDHRRITDLAFFHSGNFPLGVHILLALDNNSFSWVNLEEVIKGKNYGFLSVCPLNDADPHKGKKYGGTIPGVTVKAFFRARSAGDPIFLTSTTLYQTNSGNHLLPFIPFGLNEPENYIERLVVVYPIPASRNYEQYKLQQQGIPPNVQCVIHAHPADSPQSWRLNTFLDPSINALTLGIIAAVILCLLGAAWLYLEAKEKKSGAEQSSNATAATTNNFFF